MYDNVTDDKDMNNKELQNFLGIMGDVMDKYKYRVMWRLDKPIAAKLLWQKWFG